MTTKSDNLAADAAKAARIIKETTESTATALNIQYIQKDIVEIKEAVKSLAANQDGKIEELQNKFDNLSKIVYITAGSLTVMEVALKFLVK